MTFTASNGITVYVRDGGTVQFQHGTRKESCGILQVFPHSEWWQALREFFRAEDDERLSRWRSSESPEWTAIVQDGSNWIYFRHEDGEREFSVGPEGAGLNAWAPELKAVAREYFDAHPKDKPLPEVDGIYAVSPRVHPYERLIQRRDGEWIHLRRSAGEFNELITAQTIAQSAANEGRLTRLVPEGEPT